MKDVYFDPELLNLSVAMTSQSVVKHFLTEGDKFLVSRLSPLADQGGYAIASNYGRTVALISSSGF
jgi:oligosaccharide translocation protein RFT1